jgi:hypothetical protein
MENESNKSVIRLRLMYEDYQAIKVASARYTEYQASVFDIEFDEATDVMVFDLVFRSVPKKLVSSRLTAFLIRTFKQKD